MWVLLRLPRFGGRPSHASDATIGLDIAKSVFQVHGVDAEGNVVVRRQLKRRYVFAFFQRLPPCLVGIEACASAHHWSRELQALGHTVRLMPPAYVPTYVEAGIRTMQLTPRRSAGRSPGLICGLWRPRHGSNEVRLALHRTRHLLIRQQTSVINAIRALILAEFGIVAQLGAMVSSNCSASSPMHATNGCPSSPVHLVAALGAQLRALKAQILQFDRLILAWHRSNQASRRLDDIPGVGPVLATALVATVADPMAFRSGSNFSAWIGIVPKQRSSKGKDRLRNINKRGDRYLRGLFVAGALAVIRYAKIHGTKHRPKQHSIAGAAPDQGRRHRARQ